MSTLSSIKLQIKRTQDAMAKTKLTRANNQKEYEALKVFRNHVSRTQSSFVSSNKAKMSALEAVSKYVNYNSFAKKYYRRTKDGMTDSGNKIVNIAFAYILNKLARLLNDLSREIDENTRQINMYAQRIKALEREYDKELIKEKQRQETVNAWEEV